MRESPQKTAQRGLSYVVPIAIALIFGTLACGGGTSGTGPAPISTKSGKAVRGDVRDEQGSPISGVLIESGHVSTRTREDGSFALVIENEGEEVPFTIRVDERVVEMGLMSAPGTTATDLKVETHQSELTFNALEVSLQATSDLICDKAFAAPIIYEFAGASSDPLVVVEQQAALTSRAKCIFSVEVRRNGEPVAGIPVRGVFQSSQDVPLTDKVRVTLAQSVTGTAGTADLRLDVSSRQFGVEGYLLLEAIDPLDNNRTVRIVVDPLRRR